MQLQNKWGEVLSDKLYKQGAHLMGDVVVEPTEGGYVLYSLQGNRVNQMTYSKVEIIDEAFLYLERDKSGYYMHFELHKEIPENEW